MATVALPLVRCSAWLGVMFCGVPMAMQQAEKVITQLVATRRTNDRINLAGGASRCLAGVTHKVRLSRTKVTPIWIITVGPITNVSGSKTGKAMKAGTGLTALHLGAILEAVCYRV